MNNVIIKDFIQLGPVRFLSRFIKGLRGLFIIMSLSPSNLGEYTIWLLYVFYFSFLELGIPIGLERDLPHHRGQKDETALQATANTGWSSFFYLSLMATLGLTIVGYIVFGRWVLALSLGGYLLTDKLFRAYNTNARIIFQYQVSGAAELIQAVVSLALLFYCLPRYGIYSIFPCFMSATIISVVYLSRLCPLTFQWSLQIGKTFEYIKKTCSLAFAFYSTSIFDTISVTIVALIWDKTTLGYYAFAFRIFQVCLAIFPLLIQQVIQARMYFHLAKTERENASLEDLMNPMLIYGIVTSIFWLVFYWWGMLVITKFAPEYKPSIIVLSIFIVSLLPLGVSKISSDYLCSRIYKKMIFVSCCWVMGICLQIACILLANYMFHDVFNMIPMIYVLSTLVVYFFVVGYATRIGKMRRKSLSLIAYLLSPLAAALFSTLLIYIIFNGLPSLSISRSVYFSSASILSTLVIFFWLIWSKRVHKISENVI
ncbi:MAG: hypothetical protein KAJ70_00600 [Candidatus Omnitrophica bacterium]|nr:hypothetical protein [Candidatus Omnitrophota bacterium]